MSCDRDLAIGVDIGGTNLKIGLVTRSGNILNHISKPLLRDKSGSADIEFIFHSVMNFIQKQDTDINLNGIGVSCPGILDLASGKVLYAVNLKWKDIRLEQFIPNEPGLPVYLQNDSLAGAIGEKQYGAAKDLSSFLYVCIGTGVGASLIIEGVPYRASLGEAVNLGHMSVIHNGIICSCGNRGCLEKYVSASAIAKRVRNELSTTDTLINDSLHNDTGGDLARLTYEAAEKGDLYALSVFREAGELLGIGLVNCFHLFGVGDVIIGGGLSQADTHLLDAAREVIAVRYGEHTLPVNIVKAAFPTLAGILGAAAAVFNR